MKDIVLEIVKNYWPTTLAILIIAAIIRISYLKINGKKLVLNKELFLLFFMIYLLFLFQIVTYNDVSESGMNLMPFREILRYEFGSYLFKREIIGNILLFIPFGYFVTRYCKVKKMGTIFIITLLSSLTIETVQYFIGRCFDVDDIMLNVFGGIIGFLLFVGVEAMQKKLPKLFQKDTFYNILSILLIIFILLYFFGYIHLWS